MCENFCVQLSTALIQSNDYRVNHDFRQVEIFPCGAFCAKNFN